MTTKPKNRGFSTLLLVFIIASLLALLLFALQLISLLSAKRASQIEHSQTSFFAAEGALYETIQHLKNNPEWPESLPYQDIYHLDGSEIRRNIANLDGALQVDVTATVKETKRRLRATFTRATRERLPLDIVLILDHSGSMNDGGCSSENICFPGLGCATRDVCHPLVDAQIASLGFLEQLDQNQDQVGIVGYSETVTETDLLDLTLDYDSVRNKIVSFNADLTTNLAEAVYQATAILESQGRTESTKVIIVFSDGVANRSYNDCTGCGDYPCTATCCTQDAIDQAENAKSEPRDYILFSIFLNNVNYSDCACGSPQCPCACSGNCLCASMEVGRQTLREIATEPDYFYETVNPEDLEAIYEEIALIITSPETFQYKEELPEPEEE